MEVPVLGQVQPGGYGRELADRKTKEWKAWVKPNCKQAGQLYSGRVCHGRMGSIQMLQNGMTSNWIIPKFIIQMRWKLFWIFLKKSASICNTWGLLRYTVCMVWSGVVLIQTCSSGFGSCLGSSSLAVLASWSFHWLLIAASLVLSQRSNIIHSPKAFGIVDHSAYK